MTIDKAKLKALAEAASGFCDVELAPDVVLELLAEIEENEMHMRAFGEVMRSQAAQIEQLKAENEALRNSLLEASEEIAAWGSYASDYFQEKHDLAGCVAKFHSAAMSKGEQP